MFDLVELQMKLQEARDEVRPSKVRIRTAAVDDASKLLKAGLSPCEVSDFMGLPKSVVMAEKARLDEREQAKRRYLNSLNMELPGQMAHFTIFKK